MTDQPPHSYPGGQAARGPVDPAWPPPHVEPPAERDLAPLAMDAAVILVVLAGLGILCGVLWAVFVEPTQLVRAQSGVGQDSIQLSRVFDADGWYVVVAAPAALVAGLGLGYWRRRNPVATLLLVLGGSLLAAVVMGATGFVVGPDDPSTFLAAAPVGSTADAPIEVGGGATYLAWPLPALVGMLVALLTARDAEPR